MLKEKNVELIKNLNPLIKKYSRNDKVRKIIVDEFTSRNMRASNAINILNEKLELNTLDVDTGKDLILLFVFSQGMYNAMIFKENPEGEALGEVNEGLSIILKDYFTELEIQNLEEYKLEKVVDGKKRYVFSNMIKVAEGHWRGIISAKYLAEIDAGNDIIYNFATQRDPHIDIFGLKRIKLDKTKCQIIKERLLMGQQFSDEIRLNVLHDEEDEISYNEKTGELIIISGAINIFDGYHRKTANNLAIAENPNLDFNWGLAITNFSEKKAQDFMVQIDKQKPIKQEHTKAMDTTSLGNLVVDALKDDNTEFATKIKNSDAELKFNGLTKKSILALAIEENYSNVLVDRTKIRPIAKHIGNVMDHIIGLNANEFIKNPEKTKKDSYINHKNMFLGYIALSQKLFGVRDWEDKIEQVLSKVDFSKTNKYWKDDIGFTDEDMKKVSRNHLYNFFRDLFNSKEA